MGLGKIQNKKKWLTIHHGSVELSENGVKEHYSYIEGQLLCINEVIRNYGKEDVTKWVIDMQDENNDLYSISFPYNSGIFKSIVLSLASDIFLKPSTIIRIEPYEKGNFTNVVVWSDGVKLDWIIKELPPVEEVAFNGKVYKDESKRMECIIRFVNSINTRIVKE